MGRTALNLGGNGQEGAYLGPPENGQTGCAAVDLSDY